MFWSVIAKSGGGPNPVLVPEGKILFLTAIVLDSTSAVEGPVSVWIKVSGRTEHLIAIVSSEKPNQHGIALEFNTSDEIAILVKGAVGASTHISGNLMDDEEEDDKEESRRGSSESPERFQGTRGRQMNK